MSPVRLVMLAPGHFHAALVLKEMLPGIDPHVHVYAPLDADLVAHLGRIAGFNNRADKPTSWQVDVHAGDNWPERFLRERPGNVVVLSGRNRPKIDLMRMAVEAGMHVLADKPWIIEPEQMPKLVATMQKASQAGLLLYDMMTERFETTSILQREIVDDPELFGVIEPGDAENPGVFMESIHYLKKTVAGAPLRRPAWFFDIAQQGEALADVGVHLVDLAMWMLFIDEPIDYEKDVRLLDARRWPTVIDRDQLQSITGDADFPAELHRWLNGERLDYFCNNQVVYTLRGIHVRLDVLWEPESRYGGGDVHNAVFRGTRCSAIVRQAGGKLPELFIIPNAEFKRQVGELLSLRVEAWQQKYPGTRLLAEGDELHILIPNAYRAGHEAHFAEVMAGFLGYLQAPATLPAWENPHLLAKYFTSTQGVALSRHVSAY
jgi:predicted dehydrogenase